MIKHSNSQDVLHRKIILAGWTFFGVNPNWRIYLNAYFKNVFAESVILLRK